MRWRPALPGILRVEEFQKKGTGLGFDQSYGDPDRPTRGSGLFTVYSLNDKSAGSENFNGSLNHTQRFGTVHATLTTQYQQNSYFAGLSRKPVAEHDAGPDPQCRQSNDLADERL